MGPIVVVPDNGASSTCVRLPYSLVPGMDVSSVAYQKAITTLAKQYHCRSHGPISCSKLDSEIFQTMANLGMFAFSFFFFCLVSHPP